ncbi:MULTISPECIES: hypothetical protein [Lactococcus]|jgi:hypothetical protein|nr:MULTISPECIES: hypothetical protein [Lactococcus]NHI67582.1 hypothetical protein [Lactococcus garvieae]PST73230.1 hypothetical protein AEH57_01955 [Lactococcus garvieae]
MIKLPKKLNNFIKIVILISVAIQSTHYFLLFINNIFNNSIHWTIQTIISAVIAGFIASCLVSVFWDRD